MTGQRVLITGAAQGLGLQTARRLASDGWSVHLADVNTALVIEAVARISSSGGRAHAHTVNVIDPDSIAACLNDIESVDSGLDAVVNNAGVISRQPAEDFADASWELQLAVNLGGTMRCSRAAFTLLRDSDNPAIVNLASVGSTFGLSGRIAYSTAKTGVLGLTRTLATEWGKFGIRVNAVAPGYMESPMMQSGLETGVLSAERLISRTPMRRFGTAAEVANAIAFLLSPDASFITGACLPVDGGITIDGTFHDDDKELTTS